MENLHEQTDSDLIQSFHMMWDAFPGMARLISSRHIILAANQIAQEKGFVPGAVCAAVGDPQSHQGCLMAKTLQTGKAQYDLPKPGLLRGWAPVKDHPNVVVHFSISLPVPQD